MGNLGNMSNFEQRKAGPFLGALCKIIIIMNIFIYSFVYDANCTIVTTVTELMPTALRLNKIYIVAYVNWTWTLFTVLIPFAILVYLSVKIFFGLKGVRANLKR